MKNIKLTFYLFNCFYLISGAGFAQKQGAVDEIPYFKTTPRPLTIIFLSNFNS